MGDRTAAARGSADRAAGDALVADLYGLVHEEREATRRHLHEMWDRPLTERLRRGITQGFVRVAAGPESDTVWAYPDDGESRFREGDRLFLHRGSVADPLSEQLAFEMEEDDRWLLRGHGLASVPDAVGDAGCYADPDDLDLTAFYERALRDIATSVHGREVLLPLLAGRLPITFDERDMDDARRVALEEGLDESQAEAVAWAHGARQVACIQGPPGTGKTLVLGLVTRLAVERGERVLVSSHTHMAINNALNHVHRHGVPVVKVGRATQRRGLDDAIACVDGLDGWDARPTDGYVVGATPFATCTHRLADYRFDTVVFDESSQVTVLLALMAMRAADRFVFIGDPAQLPPVLRSRSVLDAERHSIVAHLTAHTAAHTVMLERTYRMNRWLTRWPSDAFYGGVLQADGPNRDRRLRLDPVPAGPPGALNGAHPVVFIPVCDPDARARSPAEASLVADLCAAAVAGGLDPGEIGVVSPYRLQGRAIRAALAGRLGRRDARRVVADTVERMQGQERELVILSLTTGDTAFLSAVAGFFFQPQRLNVAITRARTKLIVIGPTADRLPLTTHPTIAHWIDRYRDLIAHCHTVRA